VDCDYQEIKFNAEFDSSGSALMQVVCGGWGIKTPATDWALLILAFVCMFETSEHHVI